ncbi:unnamed protein product [Auanema sp. JU1783]|nr:unnamed protein product [Auanema sp. JU1783]
MLKDTASWVQSQGRAVAGFVDNAVQNPNSLSYLTVGATAVAAMGLGYYLTRETNNKLTPLVDPNNQSEVKPDGSRVCAYLKGKELVPYMFDDARTLYQGVRRGARLSNNGPMLGSRVKQANGSEPYVWISYNEVLDRANNVSVAFRELGIPVGNDINIGIYSKNRPEWIITELATYNYSNVIVPIYETLGSEACVYILNQAEIPIIVCDAASKAAGLLKQKPNCPFLKVLVIMQTPSEEMLNEASSLGVKLLTFDQLEKLGKDSSSHSAHIEPKPEDLATICYTSGTTGTPKGVMLTHANVIADGVCMDFFKHSGIQPSDSMISFLPLAHMLERVIESVCFMVGAKVGFYRGDIRLLVDDIKELKPTVVPVVPRVLNRMYDKVMSEVNKSRVKKALFELALLYKSREMSKFIVRNDGFVDALFKNIREGLGGRVKLMITGSAPLADNVLSLIRAAMGCIVVEGYGQTECVAACTVSMEGDSKAGHVGMVIPSANIKLVDVPELGYFAKDNAGEVCVKGPIVFRGYYKNPEQTAEVLDEDGWLHTGDIGRWTKEGTLKIVDRKKHIFKLSQGEYVAPEKIENIYSRSKFIAQSFVYGESLKTCLIAVVVPDEEVLVAHCEKLHGQKETFEELCKREDVKKMILDDLIDIGKKAGLFSFEQVKDIHVSHELFSIENDLLTPTLKSKRPKLKQHFAEELAAMYAHQN